MISWPRKSIVVIVIVLHQQPTSGCLGKQLEVKIRLRGRSAGESGEEVNRARAGTTLHFFLGGTTRRWCERFRLLFRAVSDKNDVARARQELPGRVRGRIRILVPAR